MNQTQKDYHSYLLRLWRVQGDGHHWRASLEDVQTGELHGFPKSADLINYLNALTRLEGVKAAVQVYQEEPRR